MRAGKPFFIFCLVTGLVTSCAPRQTPAGQEPVFPANRLADAGSRYLRQYAHSPVDWYPWGEEASSRARAENKLMIISIGYAACHWCHVMGRETFSDTAVARLMNERFVSVKVDREARPDLDQFFMQAALMTTGEAGWPLNIIALPSGEPVYGGTYLPKDKWTALLSRMDQLYREHPADMQQLAQDISQGIRRTDAAGSGSPVVKPGAAAAHSMATGILALTDTVYGGLRGTQKFPMPGVWEFMLEYETLTGDPQVRQSLLLTLDQMLAGGIYDHVGGGFMRYTTDPAWRVPHFEKMLADNAQLASLYARAWQRTREPRYRDAALEILSFVRRELADAGHGYYTSLDAESDETEGGYYLWTEKEIVKATGNENTVFKDLYEITPFGNWSGEKGKNLLYRSEPPEVVAGRYDWAPDKFQAMTAFYRDKLRQTREKDRTPPAADDKVVTAWQALMVSAWTDAYRAIGTDSLRVAALDAAGYLRRYLQQPDGGLFRMRGQGMASGQGFADDYAYTIQAWIGLYQITFEEAWLYRADSLMQYTIAHFSDPETGGFYYTGDQQAAAAPVRLRETADHVLPGASAVLARNLLDLGTLLYRPAYVTQAHQMLRQVHAEMVAEPVYYHAWGRLALRTEWPLYEVAVVGPASHTLARELDQTLRPGLYLLGGNTPGRLPLLADKLQPGTTWIYVCRDHTCQRPVRTVAEAWTQLQSGK